MYGGFFIPPAAPVTVRQVGAPMIACIRLQHERSFCGRSRDTNEWFFNDAEHAVRNYSEDINKIPLGGLRCCDECVKQARAEWAKEAGTRAK